MKRKAMIRSIADAARDHGLRWEFVREGRDHEIWMFEGRAVIIPRHREVDEFTAGRILDELEPWLGRRWWRR